MVVSVRDVPRALRWTGKEYTPYINEIVPSPADAFVADGQLDRVHEMRAGYPVVPQSVTARTFEHIAARLREFRAMLAALAPTHNLVSIGGLGEGEHALVFVWVAPDDTFVRIEDFLSSDTAGCTPVGLEVLKRNAALVVVDADLDAVPPPLKNFFALLRGVSIPVPATGPDRDDEPPYHSMEIATERSRQVVGEMLTRPSLIVPSLSGGTASGTIFMGGTVCRPK